MTKSDLSYTAKRMLALCKGKENIDDFPKTETYIMYCVSRDLIIRCNKIDIWWYLENTNYKYRGKLI